MFFSVVLVIIALVGIVDVLARMVLMAVALMNVMHMARFVAMMFMAIALVDVMYMFARVVFVLVALVGVVIRAYHPDHLAVNCTKRYRVHQMLMTIACIK